MFKIKILYKFKERIKSFLVDVIELYQFIDFLNKLYIYLLK